MTGTVISKNLNSGNSYFYIKLSYQDPVTGARKQKLLGTGLTVKGNKRKAEALIPEFCEKYSYLENSPDAICLDADHDVTLCAYTKEWLLSKKSEIATSTYDSYEYRAKHILEYFGGVNPKLCDVTPRMIDRFFRKLRSSGKTNQKTGEKESLSVRSVRSVKSILNAVYDQAIVDGIVNTNPVCSISVKGKRNKDYSDEMIFLAEDEIQKLFEFLSSQEHPEFHRLVPIAFMGIYYGLRRSEIIGLKWSAIDFEKNLLHIRHTVVRVKTAEAKDSTKTASSKRSLSLFATAKSCLKSVKKEQDKYKAYFGNTYQNKAGYVFTWEDGRLYDPDYISKLFGKATETFGRPEITLHKLRHTCASLLIEKGWDPKSVQYWLGHSDIQTTLNIYAHYNRQKMNRDSADLEEMAGGCASLFLNNDGTL